jgi:hypothetical protein
VEGAVVSLRLPPIILPPALSAASLTKTWRKIVEEWKDTCIDLNPKNVVISFLVASADERSIDRRQGRTTPLISQATGMSARIDHCG